jgi:N-acetyl-anhydromuramyl-L-alanine amidase AmpD
MSMNKILMSVIALSSLQALAGCAPEPANQLGLVPQHRLDLTAPRVKLAPRPTQYVAPRPVAVAKTSEQWRTTGHRLWKYIVVHHSATARGNAASFDRSHRVERGWDELGYHFVIDNGKGGPDGRIEVGGRWTKQKWGAHTGGTPDNEYNNHGIGICLVGDFSNRMPSRAQIASLERLIRTLARRHNIDASNVIGHREAPNSSTACPGGGFQKWVANGLRAKLRTQLAGVR